VSVRSPNQDTRSWIWNIKCHALLEIRVWVHVRKKQKRQGFFWIPSQLLLSKCNNVRAQNTFFAVRNELLLRLKVGITEGGGKATAQYRYCKFLLTGTGVAAVYGSGFTYFIHPCLHVFHETPTHPQCNTHPVATSCSSSGKL
jgi:hypothetical protein